MRRLFNRLSISLKMLIVVGAGLAALALPLIVYDVTSKHQEIIVLAERHANAALDMLEAIHVQPVVHHGRSEDSDAGTETLDDSLEHFSELNENVNLWVVMGPKVVGYQESLGQKNLKHALDDIDAAVIATGAPMQALNADDVLRVTRPVVLGRGDASHASCVGCHAELMAIGKDEVIGAYSAAVDLSLEFAAWRRGILWEIAAAILISAVTLTLIFGLLRTAVLRPLRRLTDVTYRLANGDAEVEVTSGERTDELGMMARSLSVFRANLIEKQALEAEQQDMLNLLETRKRRLEAALDKERELNGLQSQFVSMVSHEFRTPLAIIDGNAQRIIKRQDKIGPERLQSGIGKIRTSVVRLIGLMESVLSVSRLESGKINFEPAPADLGAIIEEVCSSHRAQSPNHKIITDLEKLPPRLCIDDALMRQVVSNILSNAIKYSPEGSGIWLNGGVTGNGNVLISVRDEGPGIPSHEIEKLFDRFFRGSSSTGIIGTGVGLHLVKIFVELHQGRVDVVSTEGKGTTFHVHLPESGSNAALPDEAAA